jgi:class 3 adenylate cyclase
LTEPPTNARPESAVERRIVTVLFCDLVGFTTLSEELDSEDVATIQDAYFAVVRETVGRYGGRLEKFIGDAAMAVFGVPRSRDDDAQRAVRAGLALVGGIQQIGARLGLDDGVLRLRVGVNTGEAVTAAAGPDEGRVTGDTVNTAARLQTAAAPMSVLVGEATALAVADVADLESMGGLELKGKAEPTPAWAVSGMRAEASRERAMGALRAPTLGRQSELAELAESWQRVAAGGAERWLIVAPPGVGKSRLLREFATVVETQGGRVWRARAQPESVSGFEPIAAVMREAVKSSGLSATDAQMLRQRLIGGGMAELRASVVSEAVAHVLAPAAAGVDARPTEDRDVLFAAWLDALDTLAGNASVAWLVEDVHWAGGDVLAFLDLAGGRPPTRGGRLVIATSRPSLLETNPDWAMADEAAGRHVLRLSTLQPNDAAALVRALVGAAVPEKLVEQIAQRSDGNCLFIEELLRTWVSVGTLVPADGGWRLAVAADEIPLPTSVQSIYAAQLDDLPPAARLLARRASVAGRRFPVRALEPLGAAVSGAATEDGLDPLRRRELVTGPLADPIVGDGFAYRHALLRDAGYASLARAERARLHARLAHWLEEAAGEHTDEIAESIAGHYAAALDSAPALARELDEGLDRSTAQRLAADWFERAARAALRLSAHEAVRTLVRRSIDLTTDQAITDQARRWELLADATATTIDMDAGVAAYERSIELYRAAIAAKSESTLAGARSGMARAVAALCKTWYEQLRFAESRDLAANVMVELGDLDPLSLGRLIVARTMGALGASGPSADGERQFERAVALARIAGDADFELVAFNALTVLRAESGRATEADWLRLEEMAKARNDLEAAISAATNAVMSKLDDYAADVLPRTARVHELAEARGVYEDVGWSDYLAAEATFVLGNWDRALELGRRTIDLGISNAYRRLTVRTWHVLVPIALVRGDIELLRRAADWYAALSGPFPDSPYARVMRPAQDLAFAEAGLVPAFTLDIEPRIASYQEEPGGPSWTAAADRVFRSWLETGDVDGAARILGAMSEAMPRYVNASSLGRGTYELLRGRLLLAQSDASAAGDAAYAAITHFRVSKAPWWIAKAIRLKLRAGPSDTALEREVVEIEQQLGAVAPTR